ncbi:MAG: sulfatase [Rikenellaceae bacterium]
MKKTLLTIAALPIVTVSVAQSSKLDKPNIVFFLVDDMGWQDCAVPFHSDTTQWNRNFETPNMERLAQKGMKFTNAYAASVSSPSRVSLMSGVSPTRHGVTNWTMFKNKSTDGANKYFTFEGWNVNGLQVEEGIEHTFHATTLAEVLNKNGYTTLFVGKAHFGAKDTPSQEPLNLGFDYNIAGHAAGGPASYLSEQHYGNNLEPVPANAVPGLEKYYDSGTFLTEALTQESIGLMDRAVEDDKPFFLYMSHYAVHIPFMADNRFYQKYINRGLEEYEARFASLVEGMDKSLGDIMDYLDKKGISDNTIILFMSDNGGYTVGVRLNTFGGVNKMSPLRGGKGSLYEGGVREPMLAYVPGLTKAGSVNNSQLIIEDYFPTILDLAGVANSELVQKLDSKSFIKAFKGETINKNRPFYWHFPNDWGERNNDCGAPSSSLLLGDMKYIHFYETSTNELYDLSNDLGERNNLVGQSKKYDKMAKKMARLLSDKLREEGSSMPTSKTTGEKAPYPDQTFY